MVLPPPIPTLRASRTRNLTRPDERFLLGGVTGTHRAVEEVHQGPKADHFLIITHLEMPLEVVKVEVRRNVRVVEFRKTLEEGLEGAQMPEPYRPSTKRWPRSWTQLMLR